MKTLTPSGKAFESAFYREALPYLLENYEVEDLWAPKCYLARKDVLVLEDLKSPGFQIIIKPFEAKKLRSAVVMLLEASLKTPLDKVFVEFFKEKTFINDGDPQWK